MAITCLAVIECMIKLTLIPLIGMGLQVGSLKLLEVKMSDFRFIKETIARFTETVKRLLIETV